jgi:hypothetical protein
LLFPVPVWAGRAGEVGGLMSEAAVPESVTIAAVPERAGLARAFVAAVLGEAHPGKDLAVRLASELAAKQGAAQRLCGPGWPGDRSRTGLRGLANEDARYQSWPARQDAAAAELRPAPARRPRTRQDASPPRQTPGESLRS